MQELETPEEKAIEIINWVKDDVACLYTVSEIKIALKDVSKERYDFYDQVHTYILKHFLIE